MSKRTTCCFIHALLEIARVTWMVYFVEIVNSMYQSMFLFICCLKLYLRVYSKEEAQIFYALLFLNMHWRFLTVRADWTSGYWTTCLLNHWWLNHVLPESRTFWTKCLLNNWWQPRAYWTTDNWATCLLNPVLTEPRAYWTTCLLNHVHTEPSDGWIKWWSH